MMDGREEFNTKFKLAIEKARKNDNKFKDSIIVGYDENEDPITEDREYDFYNDMHMAELEDLNELIISEEDEIKKNYKQYDKLIKMLPLDYQRVIYWIIRKQHIKQNPYTAGKKRKTKRSKRSRKQTRRRR